MKGWSFLAAAAAALCGLTASPVHGALRPHAFTLSPMAGGYFFESDQDLKTSSLYTIGLGYAFTERWMGEIVTGYIDTRSDVGGNDEVDGYPLHLDILYHFRPAKRVVPYLALGLGGLWLDDPGGDTDVDTVFGYGGGVRVFLTDSVALRADLRHFYVLENLRFEGEGQNNVTAVGGLSFHFGGDVEPPPQVDSDGDGVIDVFDRCPDTRLGVPVDGFGCPADADRDGVPDYLDRCPGTPSGVRVTKEGCPLDADGDGVADGQDRCPDTPAGATVDPSGCPVEAAPPPLAPSAPVPAPAKAEAPRSLSLQLEFAPGQAEIRPEFRAELARAVDFVRAHPDRKILVEGHTDSVGSEEANLRLSQRRAESVRRYLLEATGISEERIRAVGYGESRPLAENSTQEGRQRNRRVVITVGDGA